MNSANFVGNYPISDEQQEIINKVKDQVKYIYHKLFYEYSYIIL